MVDLAAETVSERLLDPAARSATLAALESHAAPIPTTVSLAVAPALLGLMAMDAAEVARDMYDRAGLLLVRLYAEALPDVVAVHGAAFGEEGYERLWNAASVLNTALRQPAAQLTRADAMSYACYAAYDPIMAARGYTKPWSAAGITVQEFVGLFMSAEPITSKKKQPEDDVPTKMLTLLMELLKKNELPELAIGGAWAGASYSIIGRPSVGPVALEHGVVELAVEQLKAIGSPADWVSISRGKAGRAYKLLNTIGETCKHFSGEVLRPDLAACVTSGLFDLCIAATTAVAAAGVDGLQDTHHSVVYNALSLVRICRAQPGCEGKIRGTADALAFCLMNDLECMVDLGITTGGTAAQICCGVFGRDEGGSDFSFTAQHIETLLTRWSKIVRADGWYQKAKPSADTIMALELCISDSNKPLLLAHRDFLPYVVDALLLDADHPRADMKPELKGWCQQHHAECLAQLAMFAPARETLRADPSVIPALEAVAEGGLTAEARQFAEAALLALSEKELHIAAEGQKHVMLSYQWDVQATIKRINESLIARGYVTWFDLTNMKGSTVDAMSDAIEGADVMLYGVSMAYKESANCRMEANYAHQQELDMIPLMMQKGYKPQGWLGLILGTRMWYAMWDAEKDDDASLDRRLDSIIREIGQRGKAMVAEPPGLLGSSATVHAHAAAPAPAPAPAPAFAPAPAPAATAPASAKMAPAVRSRRRTPALAAAASIPAASIPARAQTGDVVSELARERDELAQQLQELSAQMASMELSATQAQTPMISPTQLSEAFMLERADRLDRRAERAERAERQATLAERQTERERADRSEARLVAAFSVATCTCGLGAAVIGAALLRGRGV